MKTKEFNLADIINERKSVRVFDPSIIISNDVINEILELATAAPSSSNLQSWRFMIFNDEKSKMELKTFTENGILTNPLAVESSSAVIAVLGDADAYERVEQIYTQNVVEGHMDDTIKDRTVAGVRALYPHTSNEQRMNVASFDAGLVSMQLMLIAKEKGYDTLTMGGFDKVAFAKNYNLASNEFPIVLIALGKAAVPAYNSSRLPLEDVVRYI